MIHHQGSNFVADTSFLINFLKIDRLDLLKKYPANFIITDHVIVEITDFYREQKDRLMKALAQKILTKISVIEENALDLFGELVKKNRLGTGECSAIAYAISKRYSLAIDDKRAIKEALSISAELEMLRTEEFIFRLLQSRIITGEDAGVIIKNWEQKHRFKIKNSIQLLETVTVS